MDWMRVIEDRHSVRQYRNRPIEQEKREKLLECVEECNREGHLHLQIVFDDPSCFDTQMARYGKFAGVQNYIICAGEKSPDLEERCGYYGEKLVLLAQSMKLNTCWVGLTYGKGKSKAQLLKGEKIVCVIALGYGETSGMGHRVKKYTDVSNYEEKSPEWFKEGVRAAVLAPTAVNQQKFFFETQGDQVLASSGRGFFTKVDLGIAKYHFELISGHKVDVR